MNRTEPSMCGGNAVFLSNYFDYLLWPPYETGQAIIFLPCGFFPSFFFSSPNLSGCRVGCLPYFHTLCGLSANLECRSEMCCTRLAGNTGRNKSPFWHRRTTLSGHILGTKACIDNRKKNLLNSNTSSTCPANMVNFGLLTAEICSRVSGTPEISTGFASWQRYCMALW